MSALDLIDTIVLVMLENRSFDHMLGHLSYGRHANGSDADGITAPLRRDAWAQRLPGRAVLSLRDEGPPAVRRPAARPRRDPTQMRRSAAAGTYAMDGFAKSYFGASPNNRTTKPDPLGFLLPADVPMTRFLADQYAVCDRWFASLPAGTQPNRLMAWTGTSLIDGNGFLPPRDPLLIDWLDRNLVRWRVYTSGLSFFLLLARRRRSGRTSGASSGSRPT